MASADLIENVNMLKSINAAKESLDVSSRNGLQSYLGEVKKQADNEVENISQIINENSKGFLKGLLSMFLPPRGDNRQANTLAVSVDGKNERVGSDSLREKMGNAARSVKERDSKSSILGKQHDKNDVSERLGR